MFGEVLHNVGVVVQALGDRRGAVPDHELAVLSPDWNRVRDRFRKGACEREHVTVKDDYWAVNLWRQHRLGVDSSGGQGAAPGHVSLRVIALPHVLQVAGVEVDQDNEKWRLEPRRQATTAQLFENVLVQLGVPHAVLSVGITALLRQPFGQFRKRGDTARLVELGPAERVGEVGIGLVDLPLSSLQVRVRGVGVREVVHLVRTVGRGVGRTPCGAEGGHNGQNRELHAQSKLDAADDAFWYETCHLIDQPSDG